MNLKQQRAMNRAARRERLNAARTNLRTKVLAQRLTDGIDPLEASHLMHIVDSCRNLGDVQRTHLTIKATLK